MLVNKLLAYSARTNSVSLPPYLKMGEKEGGREGGRGREGEREGGREGGRERGREGERERRIKERDSVSIVSSLIL